MSTRKNAFPFGYKSILVSAAIAAFAVPFTVQAADAGAKTRAEVKQELDKAHKEGTHDMGGTVSTLKQPPAGSKTSRQQVEKELEKAHKEGTHDMGGTVSTVKQAPVGSKTSRQQVKKDLDKAHKEGTHDMGGEASPTKP
ncbi:MAG: DUF4148 domain-containing protein [Rubrivivax sp.]|nr:DUF4148 domain-containing protein [Rubrivivax sp.]